MPAAEAATNPEVIRPNKQANKAKATKPEPDTKPDPETPPAAETAAAAPAPDPSFEDSSRKTEAKIASLTAGLKADAAANPRPVYHKLGQADLKRAEVARPDYRIVVRDLSITLEDILRPEYWANVGALLKEAIKRWPFACVEVIWDDASRYVRLLVIDADNLWAKVKVIEDIDLDGALEEAEALRTTASLNNAYTIKRISPSIGWAVIRNSDQRRLKQNLGSKEEAQKWVEELQKAHAR